MKANRLTKETVMDVGITDRKFPNFAVGDTIKVAQVVREGNKERIQMFQGDVIAFHNNGIATTFTIRKIGANSIAVEKILPYFSPIIKDITLVKMGDVRRAKLYYVRDRIGKAARIKEKIVKKNRSKVENKKIQAVEKPAAEEKNETTFEKKEIVSPETMEKKKK